MDISDKHMMRQYLVRYFTESEIESDILIMNENDPNNELINTLEEALSVKRAINRK